MKIGFTSTSFRQIRNAEKIVRIAVRSGAEIIEWGGDVHVKSVEDARLVKKLCGDAGIEISSYGSYYRIGSNNSSERKRVCEIASETGCSSVRVWLGSCGSESADSAEYAKLVSDARSVCAEAEKYGLKVCPECHDNTFNDNTDAFLNIYRDVGCENFGTYFQSRYRRKDYDLDRIKRTASYLESVHISYSEQTREQLLFPDRSYIDALIERLIQSGFDGNLLVEYTYLFSWCGIAACMKKDIEKIRAKVEKIK